MYREQYGLDIVITRFANVYGLRCHGVIHDFLDKIAKNPNTEIFSIVSATHRWFPSSALIRIIGTGQQSRDFVHVSDVVDLLATVGSLESANGKTYNVGLGKTIKIIDLAKMMLQILNLQDKTVVTTTGTSWQGDIHTIWFNNEKAKKELNWNPKVTLEDSIKEVIAARNLK